MLSPVEHVDAARLGLLHVCVSSLRSHEAILKIPNEEFYDGKLQVFAGKKEREAFCSWDGLGRKV